jgi:CheY-like chemotaxis protein
MMSASSPARRVLVVEDEFLLAEMMADALRDHGFDVETAANATDALRCLASGEPCDALFTDIDLHDRVDGAQLSRIARELRPRLPVVYASGAIESLDQLTAVPGARFVPKPYDPDAVCDMIEGMTGSAPIHRA